MRGAKLRYQTITLDRSYSKISAARFTEEQPIDCPDCYDTMIVVHGWDKFSYLCENCGLTLANQIYVSINDSDGEVRQ